MKSLFTKTVAATLAFSSMAIALGVISKDEVNKKIATITSKYNDQNTNISFAFTDLKIDSVRALDLGLIVNAYKKGSENELILKLENAAYHYGDGSAPTLAGDLSLQLDLVKAVGQDAINSTALDFEKVVNDMAAEYTQKYGTAVTVDSKVEDLKRDAQGNIESMNVRLGATMDFSKLPSNLKAEDVEFKKFKAHISISRTNLKGTMAVVINPLNKAFDTNQPGLKEFIEKLLNEDPQVYQDVADFVDTVNLFADMLVNRKANQP